MKSMLGTILALFALAAFGCGGAPGILVGFAVNGQTGEPINFFDQSGARNNLSDNSDSTKEIYTIVDGKFVRAKPCNSGDSNDNNKIPPDGCFRIAGIPYGEELPIFAQADGFERFHGTIKDWKEPMTDGAGNKVVTETKQIFRNIRMFPKNFTVDYKILVNYNGRGMNGVTVACQIQTDANALQTDGTFIPPEDTMSKAVTQNIDGSNGDGVAKISGGDLVNGATYHCEAFRNDEYNNFGVMQGSVDFVAGVNAPEINLPLKSGGAANLDLVYAVYSNADDPQDLLGQTGKLIIVFNRPVDFAPLSKDCQTYTITTSDYNGDGAQLPVPPTDVPQVGDSEQVSASISGDGLTLTVAFKSPTPQLDPREYGTSISFQGIYVHPKGGIAGQPATDGASSEVRYVVAPAGNGCFASAGLLDAKALKSARTGAQTNTIKLF